MKRVVKRNSDVITPDEAFKLYESGCIVVSIYKEQISILHTPTEYNNFGFVILSKLPKDNCHTGSATAWQAITRGCDETCEEVGLFVFQNLAELIEYTKKNNLKF